jgi:hypothetical protein
MNKKLEKRVQQLYGELTLAQPPKPVRNLAAEGKPTLHLLEDEPYLLLDIPM